jgi:hypothetical protein
MKEYIASIYRVAGRAVLDISFVLISCLTYSLTLKMGTIFSSETSVDFEWNTGHYISKDNPRENFKSYIFERNLNFM